jgi:hypothetical protein
MTTLDAITKLDLAFSHNKEFKKNWTDYIEIIVTEELEKVYPKMPLKNIEAIRKGIAKRVIQLFDPIWWEAQDPKLQQEAGFIADGHHRQFAMKSIKYNPDSVTSPWETAKDCFSENAKSDYAEEVARLKALLDEWIAKDTYLTPVLAEILAYFTKTPIEFWLKREAHYRAAKQK